VSPSETPPQSPGQSESQEQRESLVRGLLEITRPVNTLAAGVLTAIGAFVVGGIQSDPGAVLLAVLATWLATAGGNTINDYFDREIDAINAPERPIPRGAVGPSTALAFSGCCFLLATGSVLLLPPVAVLIAVINLGALLTYTQLFKRLPGIGNAVVALLGGSTFVFGAAAVGRPAGVAVVLFVLAGLSTLTREIIKDVEDMAGDRAEGLTTLPIAVGRRVALSIAVVVLVSAVLASPLPYLDGPFGLAYLFVVIPADLIMLSGAALSFSDPTRSQTIIKYGMFLAAAAFVVGRVARLVVMASL